MRKLLVLLAVTIVVTNTVGCGICRRMRDSLCRGSICASPAPRPVAVAPIMVQPSYAVAEPGCGFDPGCGYSGVQSMGYGGAELDCAYQSGGVMSSGGVISGGTMDLPSPGPMTTTP
jgi:hypothetical protein